MAALEDSGEAAFKRQLYQSMIGQVLNLKTEIESWRSQNVWGTTFWMCTSLFFSCCSCLLLLLAYS